MNVVDSSGWLEYFADGPNAAFFAPAIEEIDSLLVPTITMYEVFKRTLTLRNIESARVYVLRMAEGRVVGLNEELAVEAAQFSWQHKLSLADSIIYATARSSEAMLWTQDADFKDLVGVQYREKHKN
jgi:predicted nucleic acid-binding protein